MKTVGAENGAQLSRFPSADNPNYGQIQRAKIKAPT